MLRGQGRNGASADIHPDGLDADGRGRVAGENGIQAAGLAVDGKDGDVVRILVAADEAAAGRVDIEIARGFAAAGDGIDARERAVGQEKELFEES